MVAAHTTIASLRVYEDDVFTVDHSDACTVPGYLILRLRTPAVSLADLAPETAALLGLMISRSTQAIESIVMADRVYCLSFCEVDRRLHFHLFPRTQWLLSEYWQASGTGAEPVNGPALFEWARRTMVPGTGACEGGLGIPAVCEALRANLVSYGRIRP